MVKFIDKGRFFKYIRLIWILFFALLISSWLFFKSVEYNFLGLFGKIPDFEILENPRNQVASEIYTADNVLMGKYYLENRTPITYDELSPYLINALIATEDVRFEKHSGVDLKALVRVLTYLGSQGGGSTLSQQVAKNLFRTRQEESRGSLHGIPVLRMLATKSKEWVTAVKIERRYTKKEIVEMYLNTVSFGSNAFGVHTAARTFFDKHPSELNVQESAVLIGLLKAPSRYSPISQPKNAKKRRNTVIEQMKKYGYLTASQSEFYKKLPIELKFGKIEKVAGIAPYFRVEAQKYLEKWAEENGRDLYRDGLRIYTTIDSRMQTYAEEAVDEHLEKFQKIFYDHWKGRNPWVDVWNKELPNFIEKEARKSQRYRDLKYQILNGSKRKLTKTENKKILAEMRKKIPMRVYSMQGEKDTVLSPLDSIRYYKHFLQAGFMVMEPTTGYIKAWVGGNNFKHFQYDHVYQSKRQPGSTFKPIIYSAAIDHNNLTPCTQLQDVKTCFGSWCPRNATLVYSGATMTLKRGLATSTNTIAAQLIKMSGVDVAIEYARDLGIKSPIERTATICLGTSDVSIFELLGAYSAFGNKGRHTEPTFITRIEDRHGNIIKEFIPKVRQAIDESLAYQMLDMMQGTTKSGGTAVSIHGYGSGENNVGWHNEIAAKTGTTQNNSDAWFMGMTPTLAAGVWVGGDTRATRFRTIYYGQGAVLALPVWGKFFAKLYADPELRKRYPKGAFERPEDLDIELDCAKMLAEEKGESILD